MPEKSPSHAASHGGEVLGYLFGLLGVMSFSLTLPATRVAVQSIDPVLVASGRAVVAAMLGGLCLLLARARCPRGTQWASVAVVAICLGCVFPFLVSIGSLYAPSSHGAVILGLLPIFTSLAGMLRVGERPSRGFWLAGAFGSSVVIAFALWQNRGHGLHVADVALFAAAIAASFGYAEAARVAPFIGSWQVICWALIVAFPATISIAILRWSAQPPHGVAPMAWGAFAYIAAISQFGGVMIWTHGLKLGGVARVGQLQLLMPFLTFVAAALWLDESVGPLTWLAAGAVLISILLSGRAKVRRRDDQLVDPFAAPNDPDAEGQRGGPAQSQSVDSSASLRPPQTRSRSPST